VAFEQRDNSGSLFKEEDKQKDSHKDYGGKCKIGGKMYWISAWIKRPEGKKVYMSLAFDLVEQVGDEQPSGPEDDSQIPF